MVFFYEWAISASHIWTTLDISDIFPDRLDGFIILYT